MNTFSWPEVAQMVGVDGAPETSAYNIVDNLIIAKYPDRTYNYNDALVANTLYKQDALDTYAQHNVPIPDDLTEFRLIDLGLYLKDNYDKLQRLPLGQVVEVQRYAGTTFGSGGAWGIFKAYGHVPRRIVSSHNNGFVTIETIEAYANTPALLRAEWGDSIGGSRVFHYSFILWAP